MKRRIFRVSPSLCLLLGSILLLGLSQQNQAHGQRQRRQPEATSRKARPAAARETARIQIFKGLVYVKHGRVGSKSEGPDYYLQTFNQDFQLKYQQPHLWQPDYYLEFFCRRMVEVRGELKEGVIHVERIDAIPETLIPRPKTSAAAKDRAGAGANVKRRASTRGR